MDSDHYVYLDNNATTQVDSRVIDFILPFFTQNYGNANSAHRLGINANSSVKVAREQVAQLLNAESQEIFFTSGATESINLIIKGVAERHQTKGRHIITVKTEHAAVIDTCQYLETKGYDITYLDVNAEGLVSLDDLKLNLRADTILVSVMYVNNETGVIQPIKEISKITKPAGVLFFSDCTQAYGKIPIDVDDLGVDYLCFSAHKIYGPKGAGGLFISARNKENKLPSLAHGGGHEKGIRSGTLNVPGIVGLGKASELCLMEMADCSTRIKSLRNELEHRLLEIPGTFVNGTTEQRIYNVSNICFPGIDANTIIGQMKDIAVSNGSACTALIVEPSHVLKAMGLDDNKAFGSIRFSFGKFNTERDVKLTIDLIKEQIRLHLIAI